MQKLNYPVLIMSPRYIQGGIVSSRDLFIAGEKNLEDGCFSQARIIDSSGYIFNVKNAKKIRWTWNPWNLFKKYRAVWVDLELSDPEKHNLDYLREELLGLLLEHPEWYAHYDETEQSLRREFSNARTVKELINSISIYP